MQQHPTLFLNKIKIKSCSSLCSCGWCTCVCVPTTPLFWSFVECVAISNKENRTSIPEKFERTPKWIQAGRPKPGRPTYIFHQICQGNFPRTEYTEPARLQKGHEDWARVQAGRPRAPLVDLSPRAFAWYLFDPSTTLSFLLSFKIYPD